MPRIQPIVTAMPDDTHTEQTLFLELMSSFAMRPELIELHHKVAAPLRALGALSVLNIGCDVGIAAHIIAENLPEGGSVIGIDDNPTLISRAIAREHHPSASFAVVDYTSLPYEDNSFDFVYLTQIFLSSSPIEAILDEMRRVLKKEGHCIICLSDLMGWQCSGLNDEMNALIQCWFLRRAMDTDAVPDALNDHFSRVLCKPNQIHEAHNGLKSLVGLNYVEFLLGDYFKQQGLIPSEQLIVHMTSLSYHEWDRFFSFEAILTFCGYDLADVQKIINPLRKLDNQGELTITLPIVVLSL